MRILFVTSNRIGDAVLSTGLLDHLIRTYPDRADHRRLRPGGRGGVLAHAVPGAADAAGEAAARAALAAAVGGRGRHVWDLVVDIRASALALAGAGAAAGGDAASGRGHKTAQLGAILGARPAAAAGRLDRAGGSRPRRARCCRRARRCWRSAPTANWRGKVWPAERFVALYAGPARRADGRRARGRVWPGRARQERALAAPVLAALPEAIDLAGRV